MSGLERIYRQQRRLADLAALLEKRRPLLAETAQLKLLVELAEVYREINKHQQALNALQQAVAIDDSDAGPHLSMAKLFETQRRLPARLNRTKRQRSAHRRQLRAPRRCCKRRICSSASSTKMTKRWRSPSKR